jgi:diguanylate cyclase (GGDEF)-like protein/PAS domain S-box-containing protein
MLLTANPPTRWQAVAGSRSVVLGASDAEALAFFRGSLGLVPVEAGDGWRVFASPSEGGDDGDGRTRLYLACDDIGAAVDQLQARPIGTPASIEAADHGRILYATLPGGGRIGLFEPGSRTARRSEGRPLSTDGRRRAAAHRSAGPDASGASASATVTGIAHRRQAQMAAERYELLWANARDIMLVIRQKDGRILEANRAAEAAYGHSRSRLLSRSVFDLQAEGGDEPVETKLNDAAVSGALYQTMHRRANGEAFPVEISSRATTTRDGEVMLISVIRDVTNRRRADEVLKQVMAEREALAMTDPLCGLANRRAFDDTAQVELERSRRYAHPLSIAFLDIDDFKRVNDEQGHGEGDRVLCAFAEVLSRSVRSVDAVARLGGDEFVVMMPETGPEDALSLARRLKDALTSIEIAGRGPLACSVGVATFPVAPASIHEMVDEADKLLLAAKAAGKNAVCGAVVAADPGSQGTDAS